ncbi:hypothetical protein AAF712_015804 [Marasmius tenuissimus]|uniref:Uncharacterized protein n=1 Tax=Marasmius tenuissimus TaxID=585030 RepID=A0ABR2Z7A5_9AGAR
MQEEEDDAGQMVESPQQHLYHSPHMSLSNSKPLNSRLSVQSISYSDTSCSQASFRTSPTQTPSFGQIPSPGTMLYSLPPATNNDESHNQSSYVARPSHPTVIDAHLQPSLSKVNQRGKTKRHRLLAKTQKQAEMIDKLKAEALKNPPKSYHRQSDRLLSISTAGFELQDIYKSPSPETPFPTSTVSIAPALKDYGDSQGYSYSRMMYSTFSHLPPFPLKAARSDEVGSMDNSTSAPISLWGDITVQVAWKEFRSRVGTSELVGVPSALQI